MAGRRPETMAKRARELAVKEKRERKRAKKAEVAALRLAGIDPYADPPGDGWRRRRCREDWLAKTPPRQRWQPPRTAPSPQAELWGPWPLRAATTAS